MSVTTGVYAADAAPRRIAGAVPLVERAAARAAEADEAGRTAVLEEFWAEVASRGTPLVEALDDDPDHRAVTFLWRGHRATRQVLLIAEGIADRADLAASRLSPLPGTDIWHLTYRLRADHRGSYRMAADISPGEPPASAELLQRRLLSLSAHAAPDPLNRRAMPGRWPDRDFSVCELPRAPALPGAGLRAGVPRGSVERHRLPAGVLGTERDVWAYLPPGGRTAGLTVLVLHDGDMWFGRLAFQDTLDALVADGTVPPLAVLAPDAVDRDTRTRELGAHDSHVRFLADELLPWAAGRLPLTTDPARTLVAGQGLGGLTSLYAGLLRPERFGNVLAQSAPVSGLDVSASRPVGASRPLTVRLDVGLHEKEILDHHHDLHETLRSRDCRVTLNAYNGGHDWACWRACLAEGLVGLLGH